MPNIAFRLARIPDALPIALMSRELIETGLAGWSWPPDRVTRSIHARDTIVLVAAVRNSVVGFAIMNFGDAQAHLSLLAVTPEDPYKRFDPPDPDDPTAPPGAAEHD